MKTIKIALTSANFNDVATALNVDIPLEKESERNSIKKVVDLPELKVIRIHMYSNGFHNNYLLVINKAKNTRKFIVSKKEQGITKIPAFVLVDIIKKIEMAYNNKHRLKLVAGKVMPTVIHYPSFELMGQQKFILKSPQELLLNNPISKVDYYSFDEDYIRILGFITMDDIKESEILHTETALNYVRTGLIPEYYYYETEGGAYPRYASDKVSKRYLDRVEGIIVTEPWCHNDYLANVSSKLPTPAYEIYDKVWDNNQQKYIKGSLRGRGVFTEDILRNLVTTTSRHIGDTYEVQNIAIETKTQGTLLFQVSSVLKPREEHKEPLTGINQWVREHLDSHLEENIYKDYVDYFTYNKIGSITGVSKYYAVNAVKMVQNEFFNDSSVSNVEGKSSRYIVCHKDNRLIYAMPYNADTALFQDNKKHNDCENTEEDGKRLNNQDMKQLELEDELIGDVLDEADEEELVLQIEGKSDNKYYTKIIIAGCRDFNNYESAKKCLDMCLPALLLDNIEIVSGGATGADALGERYAIENGYKLTRFTADWDRFGKAAGPIRNEQMAIYANYLIAFWDGASNGTGDMVNRAKRRGIPTIKFQLQRK